MFRKVVGLGALLLGGLFVLGGCVIDGSESGSNATVETQTEMYIDLDNTKNGALGLIFGMPPIDDRLDYPGGDREDWRYIVVTEQGTMSVRFHVDAPASLEGGWNIIDAEGRTLHREAFSKSQSDYAPANIPVKQGIYYFQAFATVGKSIYTLGANFTPNAYTAPIAAPMDEIEEEEQEEVVQKPSRKSKSKTSKPKQEDEPKPAKSKSKAEPADTGKRITGEITVMTEKSDGSYEVTIRGAGKDKGVETGAIGAIEGTSIKIEMTQCFNTSCRALIPAKANPKSLKKGAKVTFKL